MLLLFFNAGNASNQIRTGVNAACTQACNNTSLQTIFGGIANALVFLVGAVSVLAIIIGGLRYVTSQGDSKQTSQAKDTILYAVIGLVAAIAAFAIVQFVTNNIK